LRAAAAVFISYLSFFMFFHFIKAMNFYILYIFNSLYMYIEQKHAFLFSHKPITFH